jgi:hypothetical protein
MVGPNRTKEKAHLSDSKHHPELLLFIRKTSKKNISNFVWLDRSHAKPRELTIDTAISS